MNYVKDLRLYDLGTAKVACRVFGTAGKEIVIETGLASCGAEWWYLAARLAPRHRVLVYDRPGYGRSSPSKLPRTPANVAQELASLLEAAGFPGPCLLIGHSQGGLYAQQFARDYPARTAGLVLIDPLCADDGRFRDELTPDEYKSSGADKTPAHKVGYLACRLGLSFLLRPLLRKAPPFHYYDGFAPEAAAYILRSLTRAATYRTALEEYRLAHVESEIARLRDPAGFPAIPLYLVTHESGFAVEETMRYGGADRPAAEKVERLWQEIMGTCLALSPDSHLIRAERSGHYLHLTEFGIIEEIMKKI